jgi:hypothetical protein
MLMTFPRRVTRFYGRTKVKTTSLGHLYSLADGSVGQRTGFDADVKYASWSLDVGL